MKGLTYVHSSCVSLLFECDSILKSIANNKRYSDLKMEELGEHLLILLFDSYLQLTKWKLWSATSSAWLSRIPMRKIMSQKSFFNLLLQVWTSYLFLWFMLLPTSRPVSLFYIWLHEIFLCSREFRLDGSPLRWVVCSFEWCIQTNRTKLNWSVLLVFILGCTFHIGGLNSRLAFWNSCRNLNFWGLARGPTRPSSSLSSTLVSSRSLEPCVCLYLASMYTLGVLDDAPSLVSSWHFSILALTWPDGCHLKVAPCLSCVWGSQPTFFRWVPLGLVTLYFFIRSL